MPTGRPSDYTEEMLIKARDYLDNYQNHGHAIPSIVGLAKLLKKHRDTLYQWASEEGKEEFSDILRQINSDQRFELINGGLKGDFNPVITKLMLGQHGIHEKAQQEISGPNGGPVQTENKWQIEFVNAETPDTKET